MYFKNPDHKKNFAEIVMRDGKRDDKEYAAAYYILTCDGDIRFKALDYITEDGIDFLGMKSNEDFSSGYMTMIACAISLFNSGVKVDLADLAWLDEENFNVVLQAMRIRRYGIEGI